MLFRRRNRELDEEIAAHLAMARRDGIDPATFGNEALIKEVTRQTWRWSWLDALFQDLRYAIRMMRRTPGFTTVAVLSLALGIGANTAIFSLVDALMLRRLPVRRPDQLVELLTRSGADRWNAFSWPTYLQLRDTNTVFSGLIAAPTDSFHIRAEGRDPERVEGGFVSGNFYDVLGVHPALGRLLTPEDDRIGAPAPVAVASWAYWRTRFQGDPAILGARIQVEDAVVTVVGVLPPEFTGLQTGARQDLVLPLAMVPSIRPRNRVGDYGAKWLRLVGRLKPGVSLRQARAEMNVLFEATIAQEALLRDGHRRPSWTVDVEPAAAGLARLRDQFAKPLLILMIVVGLLLSIACANVAGLLLARASAREREMAVRVSLGAGRVRIARQMLTESLLLAGIAAAIGVGLSYFGVGALVGVLQSGRMPLELAIRPDLTVLAFTAGIALLTGALSGWARLSARQARRPAPALRESMRGMETRRRRVFGKCLVVSQVALSMVMLAAGGMFLENLAALERVDLGFRRDHVLLVALDPSRSGYTPEALARRLPAVAGTDREHPGCAGRQSFLDRADLGGWNQPLSSNHRGLPIQPGEARTVFINWIAPRYFEALGATREAGRNFQPHEAGHPAIVNRAMAQRFFPGASPLGRHVSFDGKTFFEIVGVVADAKYLEVREAAPPTMYLDAFTERNNASQFIIRTSVAPTAIAAGVRRLVREI